MINYMPERIYTKIKNDVDYLAFVADYSAMKDKCVTFEQYIKSDSDNFIGITKAKEYRVLLESIVEKYCPEYMVQYKTNNGEYSKDQLLEMYNSKEYDSEYNFFFLSNIINTSYEDNTFVEYIRLFVDDYEKLDAVEGMSSYVYLKYMYCKIYLLSLDADISIDNCEVELFNYIKLVYEDILKVTDSDTLNNYFIEAIADSIDNISNKSIDKDKLLNYINLTVSFVEDLEYQYKKYSYAYAKLLDIKNMTYLYNREYTEFLNGVIILSSYISNSLLVIPRLLKGLNYYDKCNHCMFIVLIRKYIKLKDLIPVLRVNDSIGILNLHPDDYEFSMSDITDIDTPSKEHDVVVDQYKISVDNWLASTNAVLDELKNIKV